MSESPSTAPDPRSIPGLLAVQAARYPTAPALAAPGQGPTSYALLWAHVQATVAALRAAGVGPADRVALLLPDGPDYALALIAVASAATAAPLNPSLTAPELAFALTDLGVSTLVTTSSALDTPGHALGGRLGLRVLTLTSAPSGHPAGCFTLTPSTSCGAPHPHAPWPAPDAVALVLHTSGTTARPKRVPLTHANLRASADQVAGSLALDSRDASLLVMPLFHIHGLVGAVLASLSAGGRVICPPGGFLAPRFFSWLAECHPTWVTAVPTLLQAILARAPLHADLLPSPSLRLLRSCSAPLPRQLLAILEKTFHVPIIEAYGMTEAAHQIASNPPPPALRKPGSVGLPTGCRVAILDPSSGRPVPPGASGEIAIQGPNVTPGYEGEPSPRPDGWLRTGDLGFLDPDGYLFLTGRLKELINRGGEKVAPREIDDVLLDHPAVRHALTFPAPHSRLGEDVAAAVVLQPGASCSASALQAHVAARLAPFKVPRHILFLDALPTGPTGKPQRLALANTLGFIPPDDPDGPAAFAPPASSLEAHLAHLWAELLGLPRVGRHDDFFALGGDSLLAARLVARLRAVLGLDLSPLTLWHHPTLAALAQALVNDPPLPATPAAPPLMPGPRPSVLPLSFAQERLWFLHHFAPLDPAYHRPICLRLSGRLGVPALADALTQLVHRHEALRTVFPPTPDRPCQVVLPGTPVPVPLVDCSSLAPADQPADLHRLAVAELRHPFDLARGPLLRATLFRLAPTEHVLLLVMHHIAFDGWSEAVLTRDLAALYAASVSSRPAPLPPLPLQYPDFALWQRQWLEGDALEPLLTYWRHQIRGPLPVLELPTDRPRPAIRTSEGACHVLRLPTPVADALRDLSRREGVSLFMTLLAAFQTLLHRCTGQEDILVGSPVAGRGRVELEELIGIFINTVVLRADLSGNPTFRELLGRVRAVALEAYAHQELPFERLVEALQPERSLSHTPLFQVMFQLRNVPQSMPEVPDLVIESQTLDGGVSRFDLTLDVTPEHQELRCTFEYSTDLFDPTTVARFADQFRLLLEGIVADPGRPLSALPLLSESERRQLVVEWNATQVPGADQGSLHGLVEAQVDRTPDAVAVVGEVGTLSYRELERRANQLAHHLRRLGVRPDVPVAICAERSLETVVALLGVLKAGGAYVPLDPADPPRRLAFILEDTQAPVLLTVDRLLTRLPRSTARRVVCLDGDHERITREPDERPSRSVTPDALAYVIYTSGSTGTPKGVLVPHRAIVNHLRWRQAASPLAEADAFLQKAALGFDISVWEIFAPLAAGARLVLARPGGEKDPAYLMEVIVLQGVTVAHFGPAMLGAFLDQPNVARCRSLKRVFCGGEPLSVALRDRFFTKLHAELYHQYGPTEACVDATIWRCRPDSCRRVIPIGRPIWNTQLYVLDRYGQPAPVGVPGELCIAGAGLARGYLNRPDLTAERFVPNPFVDSPGGRLYRTGDRVRYRPDGTVEFLGRLDRQVKVRGFRIELGEVEAALRKHPEVREAAVALREDVPGDTRLVAYVAPRPGAVAAPGDLHRALRESLPEYMVPSVFVPLDALPLTTSGKIDWRALPAPDRSRPETGAAFAPPRNVTEATLAAGWAELLGVSRVGIHDSFFDLGGHSLLATRVVARIRDAFGVDLPLRALFETPTVAGLAERLGRSRAPAPPDELHVLLDEVERLSDEEVRLSLGADSPEMLEDES